MSESLAKQIDRHIVQKRLERDKSYAEYKKEQGYRFPPYLAGQCSRKAVYTLLGYPEPDPTPYLLRITANGDDMHERYQTWLEEMGLLIQAEYHLEHDELHIKGRCDGLVLWNGKVHVLELKSTGGYSFRKMAESKTPDPAYVDQLMLYMHILGIPQGIIFVETIITDRAKLNIPPDDPERGFYSSDHVLEFHVPYDPAHAQRLVDKIKNINECVFNGTLPPREFAQNSFQCRFCPFQERCWTLDPDIGLPS